VTPEAARSPRPSTRAANGIRIEVEDQDAAYPITIDPLITSPAWTAQGAQAGENLGLSVATAGDVNGDGLSDVVVGAPLYDGGLLDQGAAGSSPCWWIASNRPEPISRPGRDLSRTDRARASGVYFASLRSDALLLTRKIILAR
jgi:hypothetical protein